MSSEIPLKQSTPIPTSPSSTSPPSYSASTSTTKPSGANKSSTTTLNGNKTNNNQLISVVKTLQFAWFVGHVITLLGVGFYLLTYLKIGSKYYKFWYQLIFMGVVESFGILIYQLILKKGGKLSVLLKDDNVHYFWLGANMLLLRPYVLLTTLPFALFSLFHILAYVKGYILPLFKLDEHPINSQISEFINNNNLKSIQFASLLEIYTLIWLFVRVITFRKRSLTPFIIYLIFTKIRFEKSIFTRNYIKSLELKVEDLVNQSNVPIVKQSWIHLKQFNKKIGGIYLVNDYTKEKAN